MRSVRLPFLLFAGLLLAACGGTSVVAPGILHPSYATARDGVLRYRLPAGWFDVTADPQSGGHALLLIRNDYRATIAVDEVRLDAAAKVALRKDGLMGLAPLLASLGTWEKGRVMVEAPRPLRLDDTEMCRYALAGNGAGERVEVTLVNASGRIYAVSVLLSEQGGKNGVFGALQEGFLSSLRW
jgi:hypothetical protein